MPTYYKSATDDLIKWILTTSGVHPTQPVTVGSIVSLARRISSRTPSTPLPKAIYNRFQSVIALRSAENRLWCHMESLQPSEEIRASNIRHKVFIDALQQAFDLLDSGCPENTTALKGPPTTEKENSFSSLRVYPTEDHERDDFANPTSERQPTLSVKPKRKKKQSGRRHLKPTQADHSHDLNRKTDSEARLAAIGFFRDLDALRRYALMPYDMIGELTILSYMASIWVEVASGQLNTAIAGALSLTAANMVKKLQYDLSTDFHQCRSFQAIVDLIGVSGPSPLTLPDNTLSWLDGHLILVRFIEACRQRSGDLLADTAELTDDIRLRYCLFAMIDEFGYATEDYAFGSTTLAHDLTTLVNHHGPEPFTARVQPSMVFQFQVMLDTIMASACILTTLPPHLADIYAFQDRFNETGSILKIRLRERKVQGDLETLDRLMSGIGEMGVSRLWSLCPWICGIGLAQALNAVTNYGAQLWTNSGIPLMMLHFYNMLRQNKVIHECEFLDALLKVWGGKLLVDQHQVRQRFFLNVVVAAGAKVHLFAADESTRCRKSRASRQQLLEKSIWRTKSNQFNRSTTFSCLAAAEWDPTSVAINNGRTTMRKRGERKPIDQVLRTIKIDLLQDITGPLPLAGLDMLLILLAFDLSFKDIFLNNICDQWIEDENEDPIFGEFHVVVFRWTMAIWNSGSEEHLLASMGDSLSRSLESLHISVFRYFNESGK